jgi:hypothetical protein
MHDFTPVSRQPKFGVNPEQRSEECQNTEHCSRAGLNVNPAIDQKKAEDWRNRDSICEKQRLNICTPRCPPNFSANCAQRLPPKPSSGSATVKLFDQIAGERLISRKESKPA